MTTQNDAARVERLSSLLRDLQIELLREATRRVCLLCRQGLPLNDQGAHYAPTHPHETGRCDAEPIREMIAELDDK